VERSGVSAREGAQRESAQRESAGRAAARWLTIHDELLRGLAHTLSNRIATIDAATFMLGLDGADAQGQCATLRGETERLEALLRAMRTLPRHGNAAAEPVMPGDAVQGALAVQAHHNDLRDVRCDVMIDGDVPPAYAEPLSLQHALLVAIAAAGHAAGPAGIVLHVSATSDVVRFSVTPRDAPGSNDVVDSAGDMADEHVADAEAIGWLLAAHGGKAMPVRGGAEFTVPTLAAARRAETSNVER